jgi:hypothetical protein
MIHPSSKELAGSRHGERKIRGKIELHDGDISFG